MRFFRTLCLGAALIWSAIGFTQDWNTGGNGISGFEYLGADGTSTVPLHLRTVPNLSIDFSTNNVLRMRLNANPAAATINGYTGINRNGYVGISARPDFFNPAIAPGPFSRLHLVDDEGGNFPITYAQEFGFRPWMKNGITFTGNNDQSYIGQQYMGTDATDMVIQWSDNPQTDPWGSDRLRIVFASDPTPPSSTGMASLNGLEAMRFWPADPDNVNVGIGDWLVPGSGDPTEKLDILTGSLRIRDLPTEAATLWDKVMVVDNTGVVHWRDATTFGQGDCDWVEDANGWFSCDPDDNYAVGATASQGGTKFVVRSNTAGSRIMRLFDDAGDLEFEVDDEGNLSIDGDVGDHYSSVGIGAIAAAGSKLKVKLNTGDGFSRMLKLEGASTNHLFQVYNDGELRMGTQQYSPKFNIGHPIGNGSDLVFITNQDGNNERVMQLRSVVSGTEIPFIAYTDGAASVNGQRLSSTSMFTVNKQNGLNRNLFLVSSNGDVSMGGFQNGTDRLTVYGTASKNDGNSAWTLFSDAALKTDVSKFTDGLEKIRQIEPINYRYTGIGGLDSTSVCVGVMAQDIRQVAPYMVYESELMIDSVNTMPALAYNPTALQYILVNAVKELDSTNTAQDNRIAELEDILAYCCAIISDGFGHGTGPGGGDNRINTITPDGSMQNDTELFQNIPNPFHNNTTFQYELAVSGNVELVITNMNGIQIDKLVNEPQTEGAYSLDWETQGLAPGIYFYSLLVDGQLWVKKAVKIQ